MAAKSTLVNMVAVLGITCLLCSAILGGTYAVTEEPIRVTAAEKTAKSISEVLPAFSAVEEITDGDVTYYKAVADTALVGYAIRSTVVGFGGPLTLLVGITADGIVYNTSVLSHSETPGLGAKCTTDQKFMSQWKNLNPAEKVLAVTKEGGSIDAITASTITSKAYTKAVSNALEFFNALSEEVPVISSEAEKSNEEGGQSNE